MARIAMSIKWQGAFVAAIASVQCGNLSKRLLFDKDNTFGVV
jgi:hypothetical protein